MTSSAPSRPPSQVAIGAGLTRFALKATLRNKAGYFFSLVFPLVFVMAFGVFSGVRGGFRLGVSERLDRAHPVLRSIESFTRDPGSPIQLVYGSDAELREQLDRARLAAILAPAEGGEADLALVSSASSPQGRAVADAFLRGVVAELSLREAGINRPAYRLERRELPGREIRHFDFILPGQIGFSMLSLATFGIGFTLMTLRKSLVLKRMLVTAVRPLTFVLALCLSRSVQAVLQTAILLAVGIGFFHFTLVDGWVTLLQMLLLSFLGILAFLGFGILITNLSRDEQILPVALNLFNLPQVLLAGVFFPIDGMPEWVQAIGNNLPLAYLNNALRMVALEGAGLAEVWPLVAGMFAWGAAAYALAARTFRTE